MDEEKTLGLDEFSDENEDNTINFMEEEVEAVTVTWKQKLLQWVVVLAIIVVMGAIGGLLVKVSTPPARVGPYTILISLDGFRWDYFTKFSTQAPQLLKMRQEGVYAEYMIPSFPTYTFPNHYSIVTGLYPESHGIIANHFYDPTWNESYSIHDPKTVTDGKWYGGDPFWNTIEKHGWLSASYFWPGSEAKINHHRPSIYEVYNESKPYTERVDTVLEWLQREENRPSFITLYMEKVDTEGHIYGPESQKNLYKIAAAVSQVDNAIRDLVDGLNKINMADQVNIIVISDHGMAQLSEKKVIFLDKIIDLNTVHVTNYGPTTFVLPLDTSTATLDTTYAKLTNSKSNMKVYKKEEVPEEFHFRHNSRITPLVLIADEGWSIATTQSFTEHRDYFTGGAHGYNNTLPDMRSIFVATGPAFQKGKTIPSVKNVDLYSLFLHIYGITDVDSKNGTLDALKPVLAETPTPKN